MLVSSAPIFQPIRGSWSLFRTQIVPTLPSYFSDLAGAAAGAWVGPWPLSMGCLVLSGSRALAKEGARTWVIRQAGQEEKRLPSIRADPNPAPKVHSGSAGAREEAEQSKGFRAPAPLPISSLQTRLSESPGEAAKMGSRERNRKERGSLQVCLRDSAALTLPPGIILGLQDGEAATSSSDFPPNSAFPLSLSRDLGWAAWILIDPACLPLQGHVSLSCCCNSSHCHVQTLAALCLCASGWFSNNWSYDPFTLLKLRTPKSFCLYELYPSIFTTLDI